MGYRDAAPDVKKDKDGRAVLVLPHGTSLAGKYQVSYLGTGGMSIVYRGCREGKAYFIKEVDAANSQHVISLSQEKFMLELLSHPGIVKVHDFFEQEGFCYLVTDFIEGRSLNRLISPLPDIFIQEKIVLDWARQLYDIFEYLHSQHPPIIYRDLKPQNVIRDNEGKIHLVDFGIARTYKEDSIGDTTPMGSFLTASPEHYGGKQTDERSDIYTLGATLHYLLTNGKGRGTDLFDFSPPRNINPKITEKTEKVIMRALSPGPEKRFSTIAEMKKAHLDRAAPESTRELPVAADYGETVRLEPSGRLTQIQASGKLEKPAPAEHWSVIQSFVNHALSQPKLIALFLALLILVSFTAVMLRGSGKSKAPAAVLASPQTAPSPESTVALNIASSREPDASPSFSPSIPEPGYSLIIDTSAPTAKATPTAVVVTPAAVPTVTGQPAYPVTIITPRQNIPENPHDTPAPEPPKQVVTANPQPSQVPLTKVDIFAQIFHNKKDNIMPAPRSFNGSHYEYTVSLPSGYYIVTNEENNIIFANMDEQTGAGSLRVFIIKTYKFPSNITNIDQALGTIKVSMMNGGATILDEGPLNAQKEKWLNLYGYFLSYKWYAPSPLGTKYREDFLFKDYYIPVRNTDKIYVFRTAAPEVSYSKYESTEFKQFLDSIYIVNN